MFNLFAEGNGGQPIDRSTWPRLWENQHLDSVHRSRFLNDPLCRRSGTPVKLANATCPPFRWHPLSAQDDVSLAS